MIYRMRKKAGIIKRAVIAYTRARFYLHKANHVSVKGRVHGLPCPLIISLTSYPPRFQSLYPTLLCLLNQTMAPDRIILWIAEKDMPVLPDRIKKLEKRGLTIRPTADTGCYKKIIPTLVEFPDAAIAIADDDVYYAPDWLEKMVSVWDGSTRQIVCHRAHRIVPANDGTPAPYNDWINDVPGPLDAPDILPTGCGGVFYPSGSLHPDVTSESLFLTLAPGNDDTWLYFMARRAGSSYRKTKGRFDLITWPGSQTFSLKNENVAQNANDAKIKNLISRFGWPPNP